MSITCPNFTETTKYEREGNYMIAQGWTTSSGQWSAYPYTPPAGWAFDPRYPDEMGETGSHGGCSRCAMTKVHLISTEETPITIEAVVVGAAVVAVVLYIITR